MKTPVISACFVLAAASLAVADMKIDGDTSFGVVPKDSAKLCAPGKTEATACPKGRSTEDNRKSLTTKGGSPLRISGTAKMGVAYNGEGLETINKFAIQFQFSGSTDSGLSYGTHVDSE